METRKHIAEIYRQGAEQIEATERETQDFSSEWAEAQKRIDAVALEADHGLQDAGSQWHIFTKREKDGIAVWLTWSRDAQTGAGHRIMFEPRLKDRQIGCGSNLDAVSGTSYSPADLSDTVIGQRIGELVSAVVGIQVEQRRSGK